MKLTVVVQGFKGSTCAPASEATVFLVRGVLIDGQEVTAEEITLDITPQSILRFTMRDATPVGDGFDPNECEEIWPLDDGSLAGSPFEIEFREAPQ